MKNPNEKFSNVFKNYHFWLELALSKIRVRFIRTALGPIWEVIGTFVFLTFISLVWSKLWNKPFLDFFIYLYSGFIIWKAIFSIIADGTYLFADTYANAFENIKIHPLVFCLSHTMKNLIVLFFNFPILIILMFVSDSFHLGTIYLVPLFLLFFFITGVATSFIVATFCLKFRDLIFSINVFLSLLFFVTPVIWTVDQLSQNSQKFIIKPNLIYHYIEFFRSAILNGYVGSLSIYVVSITTIVTSIAAFIIYKLVKNKLTFWIT